MINTANLSDSDSTDEELLMGDEQDNDCNLNPEQLRAAARMTQLDKGMDPAQAFRERAELRERYFDMTHKITEATKELKETGECEFFTDEGCDELERALLQADKDYERMGASGKELAADGEFLLSTAQLLLTKLQQFQRMTSEKVVRPKELAEKIIDTASLLENDRPIKVIATDPTLSRLLNDFDDEADHLPENARRHMPEDVQDEDSPMPCTFWAAIGQHFGSALAIPATMQYIRPIIQEKAPAPTQPKTKRERQGKDEKSNAKTIVLKEKDKKHDDPDTSVTIELVAIRKCLRREMRRAKSTIIPYYNFVLDPADFSKTVENMFYLSFLIKENFIKIDLDPEVMTPVIILEGELEERDDDSPLRPPKTPSHAPAPPTPQAPPPALTAAEIAAATAAAVDPNGTVLDVNSITNQAIVGFSFEIFQGMLDILGVTEAAIRR